MNNRPQGIRRPHGTAGRLLWATEDRNKTMHARRACVRNWMVDQASRPRDRGRYPIETGISRLACRDVVP